MNARSARRSRLRTAPLQGRTLASIARSMLPFYRAVAANAVYARDWSRAVVKTDLRAMQHLLRSKTPDIRFSSLASNGIGYFVGFLLPQTISQYVNGTSLRPGTTQFYFNTAAHRSAACRLLPLYAALAFRPRYAASVAAAVNRRDTARLRRLVRRWVPSAKLVSIRIEFGGFTLGFRFSFSPYTLYNEFFRDDNG